MREGGGWCSVALPVGTPQEPIRRLRQIKSAGSFAAFQISKMLEIIGIIINKSEIVAARKQNVNRKLTGKNKKITSFKQTLNGDSLQEESLKNVKELLFSPRKSVFLEVSGNLEV